MKPIQGRSLKRQMQQGFTLVELAIVLVIAGIILTAVLKGTDAINKAKVERMVADMKGLQGSLLENQKRINRLPGDCNNNGVIQLPIPVTSQVGVAAAAVDKLERDPTKLQVCPDLVTAAATSAVDTPATLAATGVKGDVYNLVYNELRRSGVVDGHRTNEELARHGFNDVYLVSSMASGVAPATVYNSNVIVIYGIPVWMAEAIDAEIDGVAQDYGASGATAGPACNGRVRLWAGNVTAGTPNTFACNAGQYGTNRDALVSISYQFDPQKLMN